MDLGTFHILQEMQGEEQKDLQTWHHARTCYGETVVAQKGIYAQKFESSPEICIIW